MGRGSLIGLSLAERRSKGYLLPRSNVRYFRRWEEFAFLLLLMIPGQKARAEGDPSIRCPLFGKHS